MTERNEFHWVHYDLDGPAHLDPTYTGTGTVYIIDLFIDLKFTGTGYEYRYRYKGFEVCFIRADLI